MKIFLILMLSSNVVYASKGKAIFPLGKVATEKYLDVVKNVDTDTLGFDPKSVSVKNENKEGSSMIASGSNSIWVYDIDINNDGKKEYFAIYVGGGSLSTSGVLSVVTKKLEVIRLDKIISKNLWNDDSGDLSKHHLWLAAPAVVFRKGKYIIRYLDRKPRTLFTEYLWEKKSFKKLKESTYNSL